MGVQSTVKKTCLFGDRKDSSQTLKRFEEEEKRGRCKGIGRKLGKIPGNLTKTEAACTWEGWGRRTWQRLL